MDTISEAESSTKRFEQQLSVFDKLHADEVKGMEERLAIYKKLHADEVQFLREELTRLKEEIEALKIKMAEMDLQKKAEPLSRLDFVMHWAPKDNK